MDHRLEIDIGFTGTANGMTREQYHMLEALFLGLKKICKVRFHHGDCIGADQQAHNLARKYGFYIIIHPPKNPKKRAFCDGDEIRPEKDYIPRNHDIVDESVQMFATPKTDEEEMRSGTWATVRYASKRQRKTHIIWPDGSLALSVAALDV